MHKLLGDKRGPPKMVYNNQLAIMFEIHEQRLNKFFRHPTFCFI